MRLSEVTSNKWAKKKNSQPKSVNTRLQKAPVKYCKHCNKPIPKTQGLSVKTYSIKEFCCREHFMLFHRVTKQCIECGQPFENYKSSNDKHCPSCANKKAESAKYKKKCANPTCPNLIHHKTIIKFGPHKKFCCLNCFVEFIGEHLRKCKKCGNPLFGYNGTMKQYETGKMHQDCEKTIFFLKKMEEISKRTYINYKEFPINDTGTTDTE